MKILPAREAFDCEGAGADSSSEVFKPGTVPAIDRMIGK